MTCTSSGKSHQHPHAHGLRLSMWCSADCGAGVGRVTERLLLRFFQEVDLVEPSAHLIQEARRKLTGGGVPGAVGRPVGFFQMGLQDLQFPQPRCLPASRSTTSHRPRRKLQSAWPAVPAVLLVSQHLCELLLASGARGMQGLTAVTGSACKALVPACLLVRSSLAAHARSRAGRAFCPAPVSQPDLQAAVQV